MERNYQIKFINPTAFQKIFDKANADDLELVEEIVKNCTKYVEDVDVGEAQIRRFYATLEGEELRERVAAVDQRRRVRHNEAITSCKMLNRIASLYGTEKVFTGDDTIREQVADFCLDLTTIIFQNRR